MTIDRDDPDEMRELAALQNIVNEARADRSREYRKMLELYQGRPQPPYRPSRRVRAATRVRAARTWLAMKIAPWIEDWS